jgi:uncharacterized peroxidase-related enzyme
MTLGGQVPQVLRILSVRPGFLRPVWEGWMRLHFSDGALTRAQHKMLATYVAGLNRCVYYSAGPAELLERHGEQYGQTAEALRAGDLAAAPVSAAERLLLEFVGTLTEGADRISDEQVQALRDAGWSEPQIAEAVSEGASLTGPCASPMRSASSCLRWSPECLRQCARSHRQEPAA